MTVKKKDRKSVEEIRKICTISEPDAQELLIDLKILWSMYSAYDLGENFDKEFNDFLKKCQDQLIVPIDMTNDDTIEKDIGSQVKSLNDLIDSYKNAKDKSKINKEEKEESLRIEKKEEEESLRIEKKEDIKYWSKFALKAIGILGSISGSLIIVYLKLSDLIDKF